MKAAAKDYLLDDERVHPIFRRKAKAVLADVRLWGRPIIVIEVFRSLERQRQLYAKGRTDDQLQKAGYSKEEIAKIRQQGFLEVDPKVTYRKTPKAHGKGLAMDVAWLVNGKVTWNVPEDWWDLYGRCAKAHGLIWGGDWKMRDKGHVELQLKEDKTHG